MAVLRWNSSSTDWMGAAAWTNVATGAGAAPAAADDLIIPSNATVAPTSNLAQTTTEYNTLTIQLGCSINIGSSGNPLKCVVEDIYHFGDGTLYFEDQGNSGASRQTENIIINSDNLTLAADINSVSGGTTAILRLVVVKGRVTVSGGLNAGSITTVEVHHRGNVGNDAQLVIAAPAGTARTITTFLMSGGIVSCGQPITTAVISAGQHTQTDNTVTTMHLTGGTVIWNVPYTSSDTGELGTLNLMGGTFDMTDGYNVKRIENYKRYASGKLKRIEQLHQIGTTFNTDGTSSQAGGGGVG